MFACMHLASNPANSNSLLHCAAIFSPRFEQILPGTVILDLQGLDRLFGSYDEIAARLMQEAQSFGLRPNIAVASNPDAAVHLARGYPDITVSKCSDERKLLAPLVVDVLSPSSEVLATLDRWGIRTLGAFAKLPVADVSSRLGQEGVRLHQLARGGGSRPLVPIVDPLRFEESMDLDYLLESLEPLTFILARLLDRVCLRLQTRGMATHELTLTLGLEKHAVFTRVLRLPLPVHNSRLLLKLFMLDLEAHSPDAAIVSAKIEARHAKPRVVQNGLFVPLSPEPEKLELTLARITGIVGEENVGAAELLNTHRPQAFEVKHFTMNSDFGFRISDLKRAKSEIRNPKSKIPLRIFRPVLDATVQLVEGIPIWIAFSGVHGPIETATGPWLASGDWWNELQWDREEWDIATPSGFYRIYFDVASRRWFAEGAYD
jgi:protein ImuB